MDDSDIDSVDDMDVTMEFQEANDALKEYELYSFDAALERVGMNDALVSWVEGKWKSFEKNEIDEYERITNEIVGIQNGLRLGLEGMFRSFVGNEMMLVVSEANVEFGRRLFLNFVSVVLRVAFEFVKLRGEECLNLGDVMEALKTLGRNVYLNNGVDEEDEKEVKYYFDCVTMKMLVDINSCVKFEDGVYLLLQKSFEDFLYVLVQTTFSMKQLSEINNINVEDFRFVLNMWKNAPCNSTSILIQQILM